MADGQWGGYREPSEPAAVSGPGSLSARTDGSAVNPPPLDRQASPQVVQGQVVPPSGGGGGASPRDAIPGLMDDSNRPDEPVTSGVSVGPGIGPVGAGLVEPVTIDKRELAPMIARLDILANLPSSTAETRRWVRELKGRLGTTN